MSRCRAGKSSGLAGTKKTVRATFPATVAGSGALTRHAFDGEWNYTLHPDRDRPDPPDTS